MQQVTSVPFCGCPQADCCGLSCPLVPAAPALSVLSPLPFAGTGAADPPPSPCQRGAELGTLRPDSPAGGGQLLLWTPSRERGLGGEVRQERSPRVGRWWAGCAVRTHAQRRCLPSHLRTSPRAALPAARSGPHSLPVPPQPGDSRVITQNPLPLLIAAHDFPFLQ